MNNPMDNMPFMNGGMTPPDNFMSAFNQARQNPQQFEEYMRRSNPQAYQQACQIRNCSNPRQVILQLAQSRGVNPNILSMFGI